MTETSTQKRFQRIAAGGNAIFQMSAGSLPNPSPEGMISPRVKASDQRYRVEGFKKDPS